MKKLLLLSGFLLLVGCGQKAQPTIENREVEVKKDEINKENSIVKNNVDESNFSILPTDEELKEVNSVDKIKKQEFENKINNIYNIRFCEEEDKKIVDQKLKEMDDFWKMVMDDKKDYLPLLRFYLKTYDKVDYFRFDGSMLLLKISDDKKDTELVANLISSDEDTCSVDPNSYFNVVINLSRKDVELWPTINHMLDLSDQFNNVYLPIHALKLSLADIIIFSAVSGDENMFIDEFSERLKKETNKENKKAIITAIAYSVTEKGQKVLEDALRNENDQDIQKIIKYYLNLENKDSLSDDNRILENDKLGKILDDYIKTGYADSDNSVFYSVKKSDLEKIRKARKNVIKYRNPSDESLDDINFLTSLLQYSFTSKN